MARIKRMGEVYSSGDVTVTVNGMQDVNPSAIEYGYSYAHEYERGIARKPRGWRMGTLEYTGSITLPLDVIAEFEKNAPDGDLARIKPFPINIVYFNDSNDMIRDLVTAKFKGNSRSVATDGELQNQFDLFVLDIKLNIG